MAGQGSATAELVGKSSSWDERAHGMVGFTLPAPLPAPLPALLPAALTAPSPYCCLNHCLYQSLHGCPHLLPMQGYFPLSRPVMGTSCPEKGQHLLFSVSHCSQGSHWPHQPTLTPLSPAVALFSLSVLAPPASETLPKPDPAPAHHCNGATTEWDRMPSPPQTPRVLSMLPLSTAAHPLPAEPCCATAKNKSINF